MKPPRWDDAPDNSREFCQQARAPWYPQLLVTTYLTLPVTKTPRARRSLDHPQSHIKGMRQTPYPPPPSPAPSSKPGRLYRVAFLVPSRQLQLNTDDVCSSNHDATRDVILSYARTAYSACLFVATSGVVTSILSFVDVVYWVEIVAFKLMEAVFWRHFFQTVRGARPCSLYKSRPLNDARPLGTTVRTVYRVVYIRLIVASLRIFRCTRLLSVRVHRRYVSSAST